MATGKYTYAVGRRKTSSATVRLFEKSGNSTINGKPIEEVYSSKFDQDRFFEPLKVAELDEKDFYFTAVAKGGGIYSQLDAVRHGLSRAIVEKFPEKRKFLKDAGLLMRDPRMKERKKPGLHKARKAEQYSKR